MRVYENKCKHFFGLMTPSLPCRAAFIQIATVCQMVRKTEIPERQSPKSSNSTDSQMLTVMSKIMKKEGRFCTSKRLYWHVVGLPGQW